MPSPLLLVIVAQAATPLSQANLEAAYRYTEARRGDAMLVWQKGKMLFEKYGPRGGIERFQPLASGTKTLNALVLLAAEMDGLVRRSDPVSRFLPQWNTNAKKTATLEQLLNLTSGLATFGGGLSGPAWAQILDAPLRSAPGKQFHYGQAPFNTFGAAIETVLRGESYEGYLQRRVLDPLGVRVQWVGRCLDGRPQLGGGASMTARGWMALGELILGDGVYKDRRVLPEGTIRSLKTTTQANPRYGLACWVGLPPENARPVGNQPPVRVAGVPDDLFMAAGAGNQRLYLIPSRNLIIVRLGSLTGHRDWSDAEFMRLIFGAARTSGPVQ